MQLPYSLRKGWMQWPTCRHILRSNLRPLLMSDRVNPFYCVLVGDALFLNRKCSQCSPSSRCNTDGDNSGVTHAWSRDRSTDRSSEVGEFASRRPRGPSSKHCPILGVLLDLGKYTHCPALSRRAERRAARLPVTMHLLILSLCLASLGARSVDGSRTGRGRQLQYAVLSTGDSSDGDINGLDTPSTASTTTSTLLQSSTPAH